MPFVAAVYTSVQGPFGGDSWMSAEARNKRGADDTKLMYKRWQNGGIDVRQIRSVTLQTSHAASATKGLATRHAHRPTLGKHNPLWLNARLPRPREPVHKMHPSQNTIEMIKRLVAFDTTSRNSNLELIEYVRSYLTDIGIDSELVYNDERNKANLYATLGPTDRRGIALSGHTDVVPVDGQEWATEPFEIVERDGRLFGRGTSDMKSFIAACLSLAPSFLERAIETPIHLAFSFDEEVGCLGVRPLIAALESRPVKPYACIIGEPTEMKVIRAHKGKLSYRCHVKGHESHSGLAHLGVNSVEAAAEVVAYMKGMARHHRDEGPFDDELSPPHTTVHTGQIRGGTALNIVPKECWFDFEFRHLPQDDPETLLEKVRAYATSLEPEMHAVNAETGFSWEMLSHIPGLNTGEDSDVVQLAKSLTGANSTGKVSFGTEAGIFEQGGIPAVVCGPGSIEQAHKPDEFIDLSQIAQCESFLGKLFERCWRE